MPDELVAVPPVAEAPGGARPHALRRCRLAIVLLFAGLYLASSSGTFLHNPDSTLMWGVARQLARGDGWAVAPEALTLLGRPYPHLEGVDGRVYFPKGMSYSAVIVPFCWAGDAFSALLREPPDPLARAPLGMAVSTAAPALIAVLEVLLIFEACLLGGFGPRLAALAALGAGLGTAIWADSKSVMSEPFIGCMLTLQFYALLRYARRDDARWLAVGSTSLGLILLCQPALLAIIGPIWAATVAWIGWRQHRLSPVRWLRSAVAFGLPLALALFVLGWLNLIRYGSVAKTGYWQVGMDFSYLYMAIYGIFFSAGKSIFLYSPPLLLTIAGARRWLRKFGAAAAFPLLLFPAFLALYGCLPYWHGDGAWGPRYFLPLTGGLAILAAGVLMPREAQRAPSSAKRLWGGLTAVGAAVQVIAVLTSTAGYFALLIHAGLLGGFDRPWRPIVYDPQLSPIVGRSHLLASRVRYSLVGSHDTWTVQRTDGTLATMDLGEADAIDLWPARLDYYDIGKRLGQASKIGWIALLVLSGAGAAMLGRSLRPPPALPEPALASRRRGEGKRRRRR